MIKSAVSTPAGLVTIEGRVERDAVWVDVSAPTDTERGEVEHTLAVKLPTRVRMRAVEPSNRYVVGDQHLEMTFTGLAQDLTDPGGPITCILKDHQLVTLHAGNLRQFEATRSYAAANPDTQAHDIFIMLVEETVESIADRLEALGTGIDDIAATIFHIDAPARRSQRHIHALMRLLGQHGTHIMRLQDCLTSLARLSLFMSQHQARIAPHLEDSAANLALGADIHALSGFAEALDNKIDFLLNAMLGVISLDQNKIMMVLSLTAAMFLPATLISSIFGMNFASMPGLTWHHGFFICLGAMVLAALVMAVIFRWRRWM